MLFLLKQPYFLIIKTRQKQEQYFGGTTPVLFKKTLILTFYSSELYKVN